MSDSERYVDVDESEVNFQAWTQWLLDSGCTPESIAAFACLRFHPLHPWGAAPISYNGKKTLAIVRPGETENKLKVVFIAVTSDMDIKDQEDRQMDGDCQFPSISSSIIN